MTSRVGWHVLTTRSVGWARSEAENGKGTGKVKDSDIKAGCLVGLCSFIGVVTFFLLRRSLGLPPWLAAPTVVGAFFVALAFALCIDACIDRIRTRNKGNKDGKRGREDHHR